MGDDRLGDAKRRARADPEDRAQARRVLDAERRIGKLETGRIVGLLTEMASAAEEPGALLRALDATLATLDAWTALPRAADWFCEHAVSSGEPDPAEPFWMAHVSSAGAAELRALTPRVAVRYREARRCALVGNSGAAWAFCSLVILDEPVRPALRARLLENLFRQVAAEEPGAELEPSWLCQHIDRAPLDGAVLRVRYQLEDPDHRLGHSMMALRIESEEAIEYWPGLDAPFNNFDRDGLLSAACQRLGLRRVLPFQLAAFLSVLAHATMDGSDGYGAERGLVPFQEGNIPYLLARFAEEG